MPRQSDPVAVWEASLDLYRSNETRAQEHADLLETVDPRWYGAVHVHNGASVVRILPVGDTLNKGSCLWITRTKSGFSLEITHNPGMATMHRTVARRHATLKNAPIVLDSALERLFEFEGRGRFGGTR